MKIPTFDEAEAACDISGGGTPLERFIYNNEPADPDDRQFREQLQAVVDYVRGELMAYASSTMPNALMSRAQYDNCLPKNRVRFDIPLYASKEK